MQICVSDDELLLGLYYCTGMRSWFDSHLIVTQKEGVCTKYFGGKLQFYYTISVTQSHGTELLHEYRVKNKEDCWCV